MRDSDLKLGMTFRCIKEYDDETFKRGKWTVAEWLNDSVSGRKLTRVQWPLTPPQTQWNMQGADCVIIDIKNFKFELEEEMPTYSMYFPTLDITDVFNLDQIVFDDYFIRLNPCARIWRDINEC